MRIITKIFNKVIKLKLIKMEELKITKENANKAYNKADENGKIVLSELFGKYLFKKSINDLKTWEDICEYSDRNPNKLPDVSAYDEIDRKRIIADFKIGIIVRVLNEDWVPDYSNGNQYKYYPWFEYKSSGRSSGFVFYDTNCVCAYAYTGSGSRHVFETREKAARAGQDFLSEYNDILL